MREVFLGGCTLVTCRFGAIVSAAFSKGRETLPLLKELNIDAPPLLDVVASSPPPPKRTIGPTEDAPVWIPNFPAEDAPVWFPPNDDGTLPTNGPPTRLEIAPSRSSSRKLSLDEEDAPEMEVLLLPPTGAPPAPRTAARADFLCEAFSGDARPGSPLSAGRREEERLFLLPPVGPRRSRAMSRLMPFTSSCQPRSWAWRRVLCITGCSRGMCQQEQTMYRMTEVRIPTYSNNLELATFTLDWGRVSWT